MYTSVSMSMFAGAAI